MSLTLKEIYRFEEFELNCVRRALLREGQPVPLPPKAFEVLAYLVIHPGEVVTKEELIQAVWPESFVEEGNLAHQVSSIRRAFADRAGYIVTVPGRGYQFTAEVERHIPAPPERSDSGEPPPAGQTFVGMQTVRERTHIVMEEAITTLSPGGSSCEAKEWRRPWVRTSLWAGASMLVAAVAGWYEYAGPGAHKPFQDFSIVQVTMTGNVALTAISGDGKYMATVVDNAEGEENLWVNDLATNSTRSILGDKVFRYENIIFSPDTNYIYFRVPGLDKAARDDLYRIPVMGGEPTRILADLDGPITFFDNGERVCFYRRLGEAKYQFVTASSEGGDEKIQATVRSPSPDDATCSPEARRAAVTQEGGVRIVDFSSSTEKSWYDPRNVPDYIGSIRWAPDGHGLIVSTLLAANYRTQLKYLPYPYGPIRTITNDLNSYDSVSLTADGKTIAAVQKIDDTNFEVARFLKSGTAPRRASLQWVKSFDWINDDEIIASGVDSGLTIANVRKNENRPINIAKNHFFIQPSLCGSNSLVASGGSFDRRGIKIFRMTLDGGNLQELTPGPVDIFPACTLDGKWIIYGNNQDPNAPQLMRIPSGGGTPRRITGGAPMNIRFSLSSDGKLLAVLGEKPLPNHHWDFTPSLFSTESWQKIASVALAAGPNMPDGYPEGPISFAPGDKSILYLTYEEGTETLWEQPLDGSPRKRLLSLPGTVRVLKLSPDGTQLGLVILTPRSDAVLFRDNRQ